MSNNSVGHRRRRRDRPGPGDAGARGRAGAQRAVQPDPAQARQRPHVAAGGPRAGRGHGAARPTTSRTATRLAGVVADELAALRTEFDAVICEGAGSPAEINLRATDLANMGLARAADLPVVLVGDIDRGGLLAHLFGTVAVLEPDDQALIAGLHRQQVPRRPGAAGARADAAARADRPSHLRRAAVRRRAVAGHRGLGVGGGPPRRRAAAAAARRAVAAGGRDPAAADLQLHRRRGAGLRTRRAGALGRPTPPTWPTPTSS